MWTCQNSKKCPFFVDGSAQECPKERWIQHENYWGPGQCLKIGDPKSQNTVDECKQSCLDIKGCNVVTYVSSMCFVNKCQIKEGPNGPPVLPGAEAYYYN